MNTYQEVWNHAELETKQFMSKHITPWAYQRMIQLLGWVGREVPPLQVLDYINGGYYTHDGRIVIASALSYTQVRKQGWVQNPVWNTLAHEMVHHIQVATNDLSRRDGKSTWVATQTTASFQQLREADPWDYTQYPWEADANARSEFVVNKMIEERLIDCVMPAAYTFQEWCDFGKEAINRPYDKFDVPNIPIFNFHT